MISIDERHYTTAELAEKWHLDPKTLREIFKKEPGIIMLRSHRNSVRRYSSIRIPESVARRVYTRLVKV
jgi:hypothetical protein